MKFAGRVVVLLGTVALVHGTNTYTLPTCATVCQSVYYGTSTDTECNAFDFECICTNTAWLSSSVCCLDENCSSEADRTQAGAYARTTCETLGYIIPSGITCSSSTASASASSASESSSQASQTSSSDSSSSSSSSSSDSSSSSSSNSNSNNDSSSNNSDSNSDDSSSSSSSSSSVKHKTNSHTVKTAVGVALGVGIPLIAAFAAFLVRRRKQKAGTAVQNPPVSQVPPAGYQAPPPQGYPPQPSYPPQGYPPQGYPPQPYQQPPAAGFVDPQKLSEPSVSPVSNTNSTPTQHEVMGNVPPPTHELPPQSRPPVTQPPPHAELPLSYPHHELPINHPPTHSELP